jgi:hypothetical protein
MDALRGGGANPYRHWNTGAGSAYRSTSPNDGASRIFERFADVKARYDGPRLSRDDGVYAIGSCFAREVEQHLYHQGARVLSLSHQVTGRSAFQDADGRARNTYFHRYTPQSLAQEVARAFDAVPGWSDDSTLIFRYGARHLDFDLGWTDGADFSREAVLERRRGAREISRGLADASRVILTLGLIEAWRHRPTGLWCNRVNPAVLKGSKNDFELCVTSYEEVLACLEDILGLLRARGRPNVQLVVTVSPVPLQQTFTDRDIVIANAEAKGVLRAAAAAFVRRHGDVHYFPSYETVIFSDPAAAWKPDRVHVEGGLVREIVTRFTNLYYAPT